MSTETPTDTAPMRTLLEDLEVWIRDGSIDGVHHDEESIHQKITEVLAAKAEPPRIIIDMTGGLIQDINANAPVKMRVIDWDNVKNPRQEDTQEETEAAVKEYEEEYKTLEAEAETMPVGYREIMGD